MSFFDRLYSIGAIRRALWKQWYPFLTWRLSREGVTFLNYALETEPPMGIPLAPADEKDRACIQLYHAVGSQVELKGKNVLEISCGHGGGASYLTRTFQPKSYVGMDLNARGIRFCKKQHKLDGLSFVRGDAENLPFESGRFDVVINVEASHCYSNLIRFRQEVARVLRPSGHLLYADFRATQWVEAWRKIMGSAPFMQMAFRDISADVARGMEMNSERSRDLVARHVPRALQESASDFAGVTGSKIYNAIKHGGISYRLGCFVKKDEP